MNLDRLRKLFVNRYLDARYTVAGLAIAAVLAFAISSLVPQVSFWPALGVILVGWVGVGLSTLVDD